MLHGELMQTSDPIQILSALPQNRFLYSIHILQREEINGNEYKHQFCVKADKIFKNDQRPTESNKIIFGDF